MQIASAEPELTRRSLDETGTALIELIQKDVPVYTGDLRDSYQKELTDPRKLIVGSKPFWGPFRRPYPTYYAPHVEFGYGDYTPKPRPHFLPAWYQADKIFTAKFKKNFGSF